MILMSKYKGQHGGKKGKKIRARPSPPPFRAMPERNRFFLWEVFPYTIWQAVLKGLVILRQKAYFGPD